jgi:hypothetical protein
MRLFPWLRLIDPSTGEQFQIADNCWTLGMIKRTVEPRPGIRWEPVADADCIDCCPDCLQQNYYPIPSQGGAWWGALTPANPAADEFFGILVDTVSIEAGLSARRRGATTLTSQAYTPRLLEVAGRMVTGSTRGTMFGWQVLNDLLTSRRVWTAELHAFCPPASEPPNLPVVDVWVPDANPTLVTVAGECDPCNRQAPGFVPKRLTAGPNVVNQTVVDSGRRTVLNVRLVSFDKMDDGGTPMCDGDDVLMIFEVLADDWYGARVDSGLTIGGFVDEARCRPYRWEWGTRQVADGGAGGCTTDPLATVPAGVSAVRGSVSAVAGAYAFPLWRRVRSALVPGIPTSGDLAVDITVTAGTTDVRNLSIDIWDAQTGLPDPATCEGELIYRAIRPIATAEIAWLPAGSKLKIDGASQTVARSCLGRAFETVEGAVGSATSPSGRYAFPYLDPAGRYWFAITADCYYINTATTVTVGLTPRYRS